MTKQGKVTEYINSYPKKRTRQSKRSGLISFFDHIYGRPEEWVGKKKVKDITPYDVYSNKYLSEKRDYIKDIIGYIASDDCPKGMGIKPYVSAIKEFLLFNDIELTQKQERMIRGRMPKGKRGRTKEDDMTPEIIQKILAHSSLKLRTAILMMSSSGMRPGELTNIDIDDLDLDSTPPSIDLRASDTKGDERRTVYFSKEAKDSLIEWLKVRDQYIKSSERKGLVKMSEEEEKTSPGLIKRGRSKANQNNKEKKLFPFTYKTLIEGWTNTISKAKVLKYDKETKRATLRPHQFRKFFRTQMAIVVPVDIVEALMGHSGYLTDAYRRYTAQQLQEFYLKGEPYLTIYKGEITQELQELRKNSDEQKDTIFEISRDNVSLKKTVAEQMAEIEQALAETKRINAETMQAINENNAFNLLIYSIYEKMEPDTKEIMGVPLVTKIADEWSKQYPNSPFIKNMKEALRLRSLSIPGSERVENVDIKKKVDKSSHLKGV